MNSYIRACLIGLIMVCCSTAGAAVTPYQIQHLIAQGNPAQAIVLVQPILRNDPHSAKAWYLDAEALDAEGNTPQAKAALYKAEQLSPDMHFANKTDLEHLEHRVGLHNLKHARENAQGFHILMILLLLFLTFASIIGVIYAYIRRKTGVSTENDRKDLMIRITEYVKSDIHRLILDASANNNTATVDRLNHATVTINQILEQLLKSQSFSTNEKQMVVARCKISFDQVVTSIQRTNGTSTVLTHVERTRDNTDSVSTITGNISTHTPPTSGCGVPHYQERSYNSRDSVFSSAPVVTQTPSLMDNVVDGIEMGVGIAIGEDIVDDIIDNSQGNMWGNSNMFGSGTDDGLSSSDNSFGGSDDGMFNSDSGSFGGTDDGLSSSDDSFGGSDDGLSSSDDSFGGSDDGMSGSDSW